MSISPHLAGTGKRKAEDLRRNIGFLCYDNLEEMVMTKENLYNEKIVIEDLI